MSDLQERVAEGSGRTRPGPVCTVFRVVSQVEDEAERQMLLHVVNHPDYVMTVIHRELREEGYVIPYDTLRRHRSRHGCYCPDEYKTDPGLPAA